MAAQHPTDVEILVDEYGNIGYTRAVLHVVPKDQVTWNCKNGEFALVFEKSPFAGGELSFHSDSKSLTSPQIDGNALGSHHYRVIVHTDQALKRPSKGRIAVDLHCPDLMVGR